MRWTPPLLSALLLVAAPAFAGDGRVEINQESVLAKGGFPFRIDRPGSYLLTGNLSVPASTSGIEIAADGVALDLNGFAVVGTHSCGPGACALGSGVGIEALPVITDEARRTTVRNGEVRGFGAECIRLGAHAGLFDLAVSSCGANCVFVQEGSRTRDSRIHECGASGLASNGPGVYSGNVIQLVALAGGSADLASRTLKGAQNLCDLATCPGERRRFYLSQNGFTGNHGGNTCAAGFHLASAWELHDPSNLEYDAVLGATQPDAGSGPPSNTGGWIRTGAAAQPTGNCALAGTPWGSSSVSDRGAGLSFLGPTGWSNPAQMSSPWNAFELSCNVFQPAWCIED